MLHILARRRAEILGNVTKYVDQYNALLCEFEAAKVGAARLSICQQMHTARHALHLTRAASAVLFTCSSAVC